MKSLKRSYGLIVVVAMALLVAGACFTTPAAAQTPYNWTGFYLGIDGGYGQTPSKSTELLTNDVTPVNLGDATTPSRGTIGNFKGRGGFGGGQTGYNMQFAPNWVAGLEADIQGGSINGSASGRDRKSTRLNSSHIQKSRMPSSA